jgi:hypothetical protein
MRPLSGKPKVRLFFSSRKTPPEDNDDGRWRRGRNQKTMDDGDAGGDAGAGVEMAYYVTLREPQLGLIVSHGMPLRVLGFKPTCSGPGILERSGRVHKGDILSVADGRDLRLMSREDAVKTIASKRPIVIGFARRERIRSRASLEKELADLEKADLMKELADCKAKNKKFEAEIQRLLGKAEERDARIEQLTAFGGAPPNLANRQSSHNSTATWCSERVSKALSLTSSSGGCTNVAAQSPL